MVRFLDVKESAGSNRLDIGKHSVQITESRNTTKNGELMTDDNGVEVWSVTFESQDEIGRAHV